MAQIRLRDEPMQLEVFEAAMFGDDDAFFAAALAWLRRDIAFDGLLWRAHVAGCAEAALRVHGRPAAMARDHDRIAALDPVTQRAVAAPDEVHALATGVVCAADAQALAFWHGYDTRQLMILAKRDHADDPVGMIGVLRASDEPFPAEQRRAMRHAAQAILLAQQLRAAKAVRATAPSTPRPPQPAEALTEREMAVAQAYADGRAVKEVARLMGLSVSTVQCHLARVYRKLGVHSKIALRKVLRDRRSRPRG
jgi:DNA-binding CsgD family transcriptional regulator